MSASEFLSGAQGASNAITNGNLNSGSVNNNPEFTGGSITTKKFEGQSA
jgi:hypothetical protein